MTDPRTRQIIDEVTKKLVSDGLLIEAGFQAYRRFVMPADAPKIQIEECRWAYFAGCQHLFASIMSMMDKGEEATEDDYRRMDQINAELAKFAEQMKLRIGLTKGNT